tara:strand:- start:915 stop:1235 length:321 start_codon:yes stop_codon:yes gene_type:complete
MKKQPNIVILEHSSRGILDTLFAPNIQKLLFEYVVEEIKKAIKFNKKEVVVCDISQLETSIFISKDEFIPVLKSSLNYFIKSEEYSKCTRITNLIEELENGQPIKE